MGRGPTSLVAPTPARPGKVRRKWARPAADSQPQGVCVCVWGEVGGWCSSGPGWEWDSRSLSE